MVAFSCRSIFRSCFKAPFNGVHSSIIYVFIRICQARPNHRESVPSSSTLYSARASDFFKAATKKFSECRVKSESVLTQGQTLDEALQMTNVNLAFISPVDSTTSFSAVTEASPSFLLKKTTAASFSCYRKELAVSTIECTPSAL